MRNGWSSGTRCELAMPKIAHGLGPLGLIFVLICGAAAPALAESFRCGDPQAHPDCVGSGTPPIQEFAAQKKRQRVTIYGRRYSPGPNAVRQCRSWLVTEYRISGTVIVPQMYCWWE